MNSIAFCSSHSRFFCWCLSPVVIGVSVLKSLIITNLGLYTLLLTPNIKGNYETNAEVNIPYQLIFNKTICQNLCNWWHIPDHFGELTQEWS
jgi:hypothetical protein